MLGTISEGRKFVEAALSAACVVKMDVVANGLGEGVVVVELVEVIHLAFEGAPKCFHGGVVDAHAGARDMLWSMPCLRSLILNLRFVY